MELSLRIDVAAQQARSELSETERAILKTSKAARDLDKSISESEKRLNKSFAEVEKNAASLEKQVEKLGQTSERKTTPAMGSLNSTLLKFASGAVVVAAIKGAADYADRLEEISIQTGVSIKALSKFDAAARTNGSSLEQLTSAASAFQDRLVGGDKSVVRGLERLGFSLDDIRRKSPQDQLLTLARSIAAIENPTERAHVVVDLFGQSGARLIPTLIEISNNYEKLPSLSDDVVKSTGKLSDAYEGLKGIGQNVIVTFLAPFAEVLGTLAGKMRDVNANKIDWATVLPGAWGIPFQQVQNAYGEYQKWSAGDPNVKPPDWYINLVESGKAGNAGSALPPASGLFGTDALFGYTGEVERQINDQLKEQARLHKARGDAAEEASKKAAKAAADELAAWNTLLANNRSLLADAQSVLGEDFNLFFGRGFTPRGGVYQGESYWGETDIPTIPSTSLGGVMGPIYGPQSAGNLAASFYQPNRRFTAQEQWNRQWMNTYGDYSSWSDGALSAGNAIGTYGPALQDLARGDTEVLRATNVMGRGNRAKAGMMAGAAEGGRYGGPYGAAGGAVIGLIIGAARNPMFEDIYNRVGANYDARGISEDLSREIEKMTKDRFEGNRQAGEIYSIGDIIKERPIDEKNISQMMARMRDAFSMRETGAFNEEELRTTLDNSFGAFADYFDRVGGLAGRRFGEIIELQRRFGVESADVAEYVKGQSQNALTGLTTFLEHSTIESAEAAKGVMGAAVLLFDELKKGPEGLKGAMAALGPVIGEIDQALATFGVEADVTFNDMRSLLGTMANEDVARAVVAVEGLGDTMVGLSNAVLLNEETYRGLARAVADTRNNIVAQGHDGEHVNRLMQEDLQTIWELQQDWEYKVDDTTQALLDQAIAQGIVGDKFRDAETQMVRALENIGQTLGEIRDLLRDDLPAAADQGASGVNDALDRINRNVDINLNYNDPGAPDQAHAYVAQGGYVGAHGIQYLETGGKVLGFRPRGSDTVPAMLTPGEGILSRRGMQALGALNRGESLDAPIVFEKGSIVVNGADDPDAVADAILRKVAQKRKLSRGRRAA